jgi:hypothetical protein
MEAGREVLSVNIPPGYSIIGQRVFVLSASHVLIKE